MSIWSRIAAAISSLTAGESLSEVFEKLRTPPERSVVFTIAVIALGAKIAKADGQVTRDEVRAFKEVFHIPPESESDAARVFNLARQDVAGFDDYARRIAKMFPPESLVLCDLMEGLFHIALADGDYSDAEDAFLNQVADVFGLDSVRFSRLRARFVKDSERDPYDILGVSPDDDAETIRTAWRKLVLQNHPDQMMARGLPQEAIKMAETRLAKINKAWEDIQMAA